MTLERANRRIGRFERFLRHERNFIHPSTGLLADRLDARLNLALQFGERVGVEHHDVGVTILDLYRRTQAESQ